MPKESTEKLEEIAELRDLGSAVGNTLCHVIAYALNDSIANQGRVEKAFVDLFEKFHDYYERT